MPNLPPPEVEEKGAIPPVVGPPAPKDNHIGTSSLHIFQIQPADDAFQPGQVRELRPGEWLDPPIHPGNLIEELNRVLGLPLQPAVARLRKQLE